MRNHWDSQFEIVSNFWCLMNGETVQVCEITKEKRWCQTCGVEKLHMDVAMLRTSSMDIRGCPGLYADVTFTLRLRYHLTVKTHCEATWIDIRVFGYGDGEGVW